METQEQIDRQIEMNERIVSEITLMSDEAQEIMLKNFEKQVAKWCDENLEVIRNNLSSIDTINTIIYQTLTSYNLLINLGQEDKCYEIVKDTIK